MNQCLVLQTGPFGMDVSPRLFGPEPMCCFEASQAERSEQGCVPSPPVLDNRTRDWSGTVCVIVGNLGKLAACHGHST